MFALGAAALAAPAGCGGGSDDNGATADQTRASGPTRVEVIRSIGKPGAFDPARIYKAEASGVVTVLTSVFGDAKALGTGFVVSPATATSRPTPTSSPTARAPDDEADEVYVAVRRRQPGAGQDHRHRPERRRRPAARSTPSGLTLRAARRWASGDRPGRRAGRGDRQPVRRGAVALGRRRLGHEPLDRVAHRASRSRGAIQTDAAINHGNSGRPAARRARRVIGINSQIRSTGGGGEGVGFAVPVDTVRRSLAQLRAHGKVAYAYLGVSVAAGLPAARRAASRCRSSNGALDLGGGRRRPGRKAGLQGRRAGAPASRRALATRRRRDHRPSPGKPITRARRLRDADRPLPAGRRVTLEYLRGGTGARRASRSASAPPAARACGRCADAARAGGRARARACASTCFRTSARTPAARTCGGRRRRRHVRDRRARPRIPGALPRRAGARGRLLLRGPRAGRARPGRRPGPRRRPHRRHAAGAGGIRGRVRLGRRGAAGDGEPRDGRRRGRRVVEIKSGAAFFAARGGRASRPTAPVRPSSGNTTLARGSSGPRLPRPAGAVDRWRCSSELIDASSVGGGDLRARLGRATTSPGSSPASSTPTSSRARGSSPRSPAAARGVRGGGRGRASSTTRPTTWPRRSLRRGGRRRRDRRPGAPLARPAPARLRRRLPDVVRGGGQRGPARADPARFERGLERLRERLDNRAAFVAAAAVPGISPFELEPGKSPPCYSPSPSVHKTLGDYTHLWAARSSRRSASLPSRCRASASCTCRATAFGGGVSEILYTLVPLMRDVGLRHRVARDLRARGVLQRDQAHAQRAPGRTRRTSRRSDWEIVGPLQRDERARARPTAGTTASSTTPSPQRLRTLVPEKATRWVWRCHIDLSTPNRPTLERLLPLFERYDASVFHMQDYVPDGDGRQGPRRPAGDRPAGAEEHGAVARGRVLRVPPVRRSTSTGR